MTFRDDVLDLTSRVPKGRVTTYRIIAEKLGTRAYRAVGQALRGNDMPVFIPCHRVVASNGSVGGYTGIRNSQEKKALLQNEGIIFEGDSIKDFNSIIFTFE